MCVVLDVTSTSTPKLAILRNLIDLLCCPPLDTYIIILFSTLSTTCGRTNHLEEVVVKEDLQRQITYEPLLKLSL